jgi:hypothetical protein
MGTPYRPAQKQLRWRLESGATVALPRSIAATVGNRCSAHASLAQDFAANFAD